MSRDRLAELLPHLPLLDALGDDEHVTRAAEALGVPQPTVSRALRQIESRLGAGAASTCGWEHPGARRERGERMCTLTCSCSEGGAHV